MLKKAILLLVCVAIFASGLVGCTKPEPEVVVPAEPKVLHLVQSSQGTTYNHQNSNMAVDNDLLTYFVGRLYVYMPLEDGSGAVLAPELAAGLPRDVSGNGTVWEIDIRPDAKWSNGEPINADTFMYSWKMLIDPLLVNFQGMGLARGNIEIKNAVAYFGQGSANTVKWEDVGIKKKGDLTLEITCVADYSADEVMTHFTAASKGPVYEPLYEAGMNATRTETQYGTNIDKMMFSGPFTLTTWVKGAERVFEKNPLYVLADKIHLDKIVYYTVENAGTRIQMFEKGELDRIGLPAEEVPKYTDDPRFSPTVSRFVRTIEFNRINPDKPILDNLNFRKAIYYAVDRNTIAKLANAIPAPLIVPTTVVATGGRLFRDVAATADYIPKNLGYDPELALSYFNKALTEEGLNKVSLSLNYSSATASTVVASEFLQESLPKIFGADRFELTLNALPSAQHLSTMKDFKVNPKSYEMAMAGWSFSSTDFNPAQIFNVYTTVHATRNAPNLCEVIDTLYPLSTTSEARKSIERLTELAMQMEKAYLEEVVGVPYLQEAGGTLTAEHVILPMKVEHPAGVFLRHADIKTRK